MYTMYVDGGGQTIKDVVFPTYFSSKVYNDNVLIKNASITNWFLQYLIPYKRTTYQAIGEEGKTLYLQPEQNLILPKGCSIRDYKGNETNNISEYAALYYGLLKLKSEIGLINVKVFQDSQLIIKQVTGVWGSKNHLRPWCTAVQNIKWRGVVIEYLPREKIVKILGH